MAEVLSPASHTFTEAQHAQASKSMLLALLGFASYWQEEEDQAAFLPELILPGCSHRRHQQLLNT